MDGVPRGRPGTPGFSVITRAASDLGGRNAPYARLFTIGFFYLAGALTIVLGVSLATAPRARSAWRLGARLVVLEGVLPVLAAAFPENLGASGGSATHQLLATMCFAAAALAPAVLAAGAPSVVMPPVLRRLSLTSGVTLLLLFVVATEARTSPRFPEGLFQRPFGLILTVWFVATGLWLLQEPASTGSGDRRQLPSPWSSRKRARLRAAATVLEMCGP